jgi:hypothetical protein
MNAHEFLTAELAHAERHLARLRRIAHQLQADLEAAGLSEVAVYEKLATHKAYRQLQRDQVAYQQLWLRVHRHLLRLPVTNANTAPITTPPPEQALTAWPKPQPYRKPPTPGPNEKCSCGSNIKYKKCCGSPLRRAA